MPLKLQILKETDLAYVAGLFDGEGSVGCSASGQCKTNYSVRISIGMCDEDAVQFAASVLGGPVRKLKRATNSGKAIYQWSLHCRKAAAALELLLPYLRLKKARACAAIRLAAMMKSRQPAKVVVLSAAETEARHILAAQLKAMNCATNGRIARYAA